MKLKDIADIEFLIGLSLTRLKERIARGDIAEQTDVWIVTAGAIDEGLIFHDKLSIVKADVNKIDAVRRAKAGDIIMKTTAPFFCALISEEPDRPLYAASSCITIRLPLSGEGACYHPAFLAAYLNLPFMQDMLQAKTTGTNASVIKKAILEELEVPELDPSEQERLGAAYLAIIEASAAHLSALASLKKIHAALFAEKLSQALGGDQ